MATNCELIEENLKSQSKFPSISNSASLTSMTHEEKQDGNEKSLSKSSISDTSSAEGSSSICSSSNSTALGNGGGGGGTLQKSKKLNNGHLPIVPSIGDCVFEQAFEKSMDDLEHGNDGYESDSEPSLNDEPELHAVNSGNLSCSTGFGSGPLHTFPRTTSFEYCSSCSESDEENEQSEDIVIHAAINNASPKFYNTDIFHIRPYLMPFMERRRLSQCKEEEDEDEAEKSPQPQSSGQPPKFETKAIPTPPPPPPAKDQASANKFKDLERLRQQFMHKIDSINTNNVDDIKTVTVAPEMSSPPPPPPIPPTILPPALINLLESAKSQSSNTTTTNAIVKPKPSKQEKPIDNTPIKPINMKESESLIVKGKFTVTKAQETPELRREAENLKNFDSSNNAHTISFPSSFGGYSSVHGVFSQRYGSGGSTSISNKSSSGTPHLSKKFFDTSLVEIRTPAESSLSLNRLGLNETSPTKSPHQIRSTNNDCDNNRVYNVHPTLSTSPAAHLQTQNNTGINILARDYPHLDDVWIKRGAIQTSTSTTPSLPKKQYYTTDDSAGESGRTTAVQSEDVSSISKINNIENGINRRWYSERKMSSDFQVIIYTMIF